MEPKILFENDDLVVLDKPFGMVVNRADTTRHMHTVQDWAESNIKYQIANIKDKLDTDFVKRAGIVHRIDKETSGALIVAKNEDAFLNLQAQFKEKRVHKMYIALCHGKLTPERGTINAPVGRLPWNRKKFGVYAQGRESVTDYEVEKYYQFEDETLSLVKCYPKTGRTHQIRVHLRYLGYPIFADPLYAGRKSSRNDRKYLERHFLHAKLITFYNPRKTDEKITVESPLPTELVDFLARLH